MAHSKQILDELMIISELVATLPSENPYKIPSGYFDSMPDILLDRVTGTAPDQSGFLFARPKHNMPYHIPSGYFDQLPGAILNRIKLEEASCEEELQILSPVLLQLKNTNTFHLPSSYFEQLPVKILEHIKLQETTSGKDGMETLPPVLLQLKNTNPFSLPPAYFEAFSASILEHVKLQETASGKDELEILSPLLRQINKTIPFTLPDNYFQEFPSDITAGVNAVDYVNQELESHAPIMTDLKIKNVYRVPEGYFANLEDGLLSTVKHQRKASIIPISFNKRILRYGVAALVAAIMSIALGMFYFNKPASNAGSELADIKTLSNDEMINYLESTPVTPIENNTGTASVTIKDEDVNELFADVPDEELIQYLDQHAVSKDLIIN